MTTSATTDDLITHAAGTAARVDDAPLREVLRAWNEAAQRWDVDGIARVYTDAAVFFGGRPGHSIGPAGVRAYFASYTGVIESTTLALQEMHLFRLGDDTLLAQGYGLFRLRLSGGQQTESRLRGTLVVVRRGGQWKLLQHHFSASPEAPSLGTSPH